MFIEFSTIYFCLKLSLYYFCIMFGLKLIRKYIINPKKSIMIILGSGGHTGEILLMIKKLDFNKFSDCFFVSSHNDKNSENKTKESIDINNFKNTKFHFIKIYRARNVGQSFISSIPTTIYSLIQSLFVLIKTRPNMVVSNGPGVAFPIIIIGYILKILMILYEFKIMFIESYCRSKSISLCGKLVEPICDRFIVLWKNLESNKREYLGKIL